MNVLSRHGLAKSAARFIGILLFCRFAYATAGVITGMPTDGWLRLTVTTPIARRSRQSTQQATGQRKGTDVSSGNVFEDDRIRVGIPVGWWAQTATETVTGDRTFQLPIGALFTKGHYKLYLLSHHEQASGIIGGRFSEVVEYVSPWMDMSESPWLPCPAEIESTKTVTTSKLSRVDLYFDTRHASRKALADCGNPVVGKTLWYGSYFVETCQRKDWPSACDSFFLAYQDLSRKPLQGAGVDASKTIGDHEWQMTYALTYDTKTPNVLPKKGDPELRGVLREASEIVTSVAYK